MWEKLLPSWVGYITIFPQINLKLSKLAVNFLDWPLKPFKISLKPFTWVPLGERGSACKRALLVLHRYQRLSGSHIPQAGVNSGWLWLLCNKFLNCSSLWMEFDLFLYYSPFLGSRISLHTLLCLLPIRKHDVVFNRWLLSLASPLFKILGLILALERWLSLLILVNRALTLLCRLQRVFINSWKNETCFAWFNFLHV